MMHNSISSSMEGKVALVTGANDGIGRATALGLAKLGATMVMVCRNLERGQAAQEAIRAESGNPAVELMLADLSSQAAIRELANEFIRTHARLDVLVNNAGVNVNERTLSVDGIELNFAVNHLAYFLLTNLLLDILKTSAPARIVNVASASEQMGVIDFDDLMSERKYSPVGAYSQAKLANVMFTYELAQRLEGSGVTVNCLHPGVTRTKMVHSLGGWVGVLTRAAQLFAITPEQAAETVLYLAASPEVQGVSGQYFENKHEKRSSERSYDQAGARRLWQECEQLTAASAEMMTAVAG